MRTLLFLLLCDLLLVVLNFLFSPLSLLNGLLVQLNTSVVLAYLDLPLLMGRLCEKFFWVQFKKLLLLPLVDSLPGLHLPVILSRL